MTKDSGKVDAVTEKETDAVFSGPSILANRFYVHIIGNQAARITFCEQSSVDKTPIYRSSVTLIPQDALALADLIKNMIKVVDSDSTDQGEPSDA